MAAIHLRIIGYVLTVALHVINLSVMQMTRNEKLSADLRIRAFRGTMYRYFTCWTVGLQIGYAILGLYCDLLTLKNAKKKNYSIWKPIKGLRNVLFAALVWPCSLGVFFIFWTLFLYDRNLIFPEFIDQIISQTSNHILHSAIVPIVVSEVILRPRIKPASHTRNLIHLAAHLMVYIAVLNYTYYERGFWLYPIFAVYYGTIHFYLIYVYMGITFLALYYLQWFINSAVHGSKVEKKKLK